MAPLVNNDNSEMSEQQLRAELRESFLRAVSELIGESCNIHTYEKSTLTATFAGWNPEGTEILVRDLKTPSAILLESALLRVPDILSVEFDQPIDLP